MIMETDISSETSVRFYHTTCSNIPRSGFFNNWVRIQISFDICFLRFMADIESSTKSVIHLFRL
jgi:hypothetical protein